MTRNVRFMTRTAISRKNEDGTEKKRIVKPLPINDIHPLWLKAPKDCTDEDYKAFYQKVFMDFNEPLFWIHLNVDYPFNLKGILYFPKQLNRMEVMPGQVKLYSNQVFRCGQHQGDHSRISASVKGCYRLSGHAA